MTVRKASDGSTLTRAQLNALTTPVVPDPQVTVNEDITQDVQVPGGNGTRTQRRSVFKAGQVVRTSEIDQLYAVPTVSSVTPATGAAAGGSRVQVNGTGFARGSHVNFGEVDREAVTVTFGGSDATAVKVLSDTAIECVTPAHAAGAVDVVVEMPAGNGTGTGEFTYT